MTDPNAMHYDLLAYSTASKHKLRDTIRDAWLTAGGLRYSLAGLTTEDERIKAAKYNAKDTTAEKDKYVHLPANNNLNIVRYSAGFFLSTTKEDLWQECVRAWFPDLVSNNDKPPYDTPDDHKDNREDIVSNNDKKLYDTLEAVKKLDRQERDYALSYIRQLAPTTADTAIAITELARRVSLPVDWLRQLLTITPGAELTRGKVWVRPLDQDDQKPPRPHPDDRREGGVRDWSNEVSQSQRNDNAPRLTP